MRSISMLLSRCLVVAFTVATAATAHADPVLFTPSLRVGDSEVLRCVIVNVGTKTRTVEVEIIQGDGDRVLGPLPLILPAGGINSVAISGTLIASEAYCKFAVEGNKSLYRAAAKIANNATDFVVVPAE